MAWTERHSEDSGKSFMLRIFILFAPGSSDNIDDQELQS